MPVTRLGTRPEGASIVEALRACSRIELSEAGRAEEQSFLSAPDGPVFSTLVEPLGGTRPAGFVICHSYAFEQLDLYPLEMTFARLAAAAGFPSIHVQARGTADSGGAFEEATPATQLRDTEVAAHHLRDRTGVRDIVPVGARWGAGIALALAGRVGARAVALWNPALDLRAYLDDLVKVYARSRIARKTVAPDDAADLSQEQLLDSLESGAVVDLFGYPLSRACYRDAASSAAGVSPTPTLRHALTVVVNPRTAEQAAADAGRLRRGGVDVRLEHAEGPGRARFGIGASPAGRRVVESQALFEDVARRTIAWADGIWGERAGLPSPASTPSRPANGDDGPAGHAEVPVYVRSRGEHLGAIVTVPPAAETSIGVVLLASRARDRAHRNGLWTKVAESVAADGSYVLRLDYPGVGNSTGEPRLFDFEDMPAGAVEDACRFLLDHTPVRRILVAGTCYGGRVVLNAAAQVAEVASAAVVVAPVLRPISAGGRVRRRVAGVLGSREPAPPGSRRHVDSEFARALHGFTERGRVTFVYGDRDPFLSDLRIALEQLGIPEGSYEVDVVAGEIDSLRSISMQRVVHDRLRAWVRRSADAFGEAR